jgi:hypothetical protein
MALQQWALPHLSELLPLDQDSLKEIITYTNTLPDTQAADHLRGLLGDSPQAVEFITSFNARRSAPATATPNQPNHTKHSSEKHDTRDNELPAYAPPAYPPPSQSASMALRRPHTNAVIEAGHARARDEVRLLLNLYAKLPDSPSII